MLFATPELSTEESVVLARIEELRRQLRFHVQENPRRWVGSLRRVAMARAIRGSNSIEGYNVSLDDAVAVVEEEEPLDAEEETKLAVAGYRDAMTYVLQLSRDPHFAHSESLIRSLHFMMLKYDMTKWPGLWRPGAIFVHHEPTGEQVYEGPPADEVPGLIAELVEELRSPDSSPALVRGAMAHLNLVMVHPFRDGNGRMARILQSLVLSQEGILTPEFASIEEYLGKQTQGYYDVLADVGAGKWQPRREARPWVRFCLTAHFRQARTLVRRVEQSERLWEVLSRDVERHDLPERNVLALFDAAQRLRVRNSRYREYAEVSEHTGNRDLNQLVRIGLLQPHGERRGRFYVATPQLLTLVEPVWEHGRDWERQDPFDAIQQPLPFATA
jgi:Fic family protein